MPTDPSDELSRPHPSHIRRDMTMRKDDVMSADTRLEELGVSGLGEVDEPAFSGLLAKCRPGPAHRSTRNGSSMPERRTTTGRCESGSSTAAQL
jgi:hypothetical protein